MPDGVHFRLDVELPPGPSDSPEDVLRDVFREALEEVRSNLSASSPRATGRLAASFNTSDIPDGAVLENLVEYAVFVREFSGAPPLGALVGPAIRDAVARRLKKRGDEVAEALLREVIEPLRQEARRG